MRLYNLHNAVIRLPHILDFSDESGVRQALFKILYYASTDDGKYLNHLFPKITEEEAESLKDYKFLLDFKSESRSFYNFRKKPSHSHPPGSICSRPFKKGEPVYRCEQCGYDETCVICASCFNEEDHTDHDVHMYISSGENGGVCDCGDPEAFTSTLNCKTQKAVSSMEDELEISSEWGDALKETIKFCFDYILNVTDYGVATLPYVHNNIDKDFTRLSTQYISEHSSLRSDEFSGVVDSNTDDSWYFILWNDEKHSLTEAVNCIMSIINCSQVRAEQIAREIDFNGRSVLKRDKDVRQLVSSANTIQGGLVSTVMSARDYNRELIVQYMFNWLLDINEVSSSPAFRKMSKNLTGEILLEPGFKFANPFPSTVMCNLIDAEAKKADTDRMLFQNGLLLDGEFINGININCNVEDSPLSYSDLKVNSLNNNGRSISFQNSRIQYLLLFSIRFTCLIRKKLGQVLLPPLISEQSRKSVFSKQVVEIYPQMISCIAYADREEDLSIMPEITSQIFTCPTSVQSILEKDQVNHIVATLATIVEENASKSGQYSVISNFPEILGKHPFNYMRLRKAVKTGLHDILYLVDKEVSVNKLDTFFSVKNLSVLLIFLKQFEQFWPIKRKTGDHIEHEALDFIIQLQYAIPVMRFVQNLSNCKTEDMSIIRKGVKFILHALTSREVEWVAPSIPQFVVSKDIVSFINPLNCLLSFVIRNQKINHFSDILFSYRNKLLKFVDYSMRSIVLAAQVKSGFWIRNGTSVSKSAFLYESPLMSDFLYQRDFFLNQISLVYVEPKALFYNILYKWELYEWYLKTENQEATIYEERFSSMCEKLIVFLYNMIVDRSDFADMEIKERSNLRAKNTLIYSLSDSPKTYSELTSNLSYDVNHMKNYDQLLHKYANFQAANGLIDSGLYRLKDEVYEELDPMSLYLDTSQFQTVYDSLISYYAKKNSENKDNVVLVPKIRYSGISEVDEKIAHMMKTRDFAKFLYKLLQYIIDTSDETFIFQLLHLIHALLIDDEALKGPDFLNESFITIPICNLLMSIAQSKMSGTIKRKVYCILENMIRKDSRVLESLIDCFGEEFMSNFDKTFITSLSKGQNKVQKLAEKRKNKVLKRFEKQRKKFMSQNNDLTELLSKDENKDIHESRHRSCVYCNEPEDTEEVFGILGTITSSSMFWKISENDASYFSLAFQNWDHQPSPGIDGQFGIGYNYFDPRRNKTKGHMTSSCGHGMHFSCYRTALRSNKYLHCPLCHSFRNLFIPSFASPAKHGIDIESRIMKSAPVQNTYNTITHSSEKSKSTDITSMIITQDSKDVTKFNKSLQDCMINHFIPQTRLYKYLGSSALKKENFLNGMQDVSVLIANTIRMSEITSRIDGASSLSNFLESIPGTTKTLIRSLIQARSISVTKRKQFSLIDDREFEVQVSEFWDSDKLYDSLFTEMVLLFFQTDESFTTIARLTYTKMFAVYTYSLLLMLSSNPSYNFVILKNHLKDLNEPSLEHMRRIIDGFDTINQSKMFSLENNGIIRGIWSGLERCFLPILRQIVIFKDILLCSQIGENEFVTHPSLADLKDRIQGSGAPGSIEVLCRILELPTMEELVSGLQSENSAFSFERRIFDIVINAKIPYFYEKGILDIDYPGVVKLIDLPEDYNKCLIGNSVAKTNCYDNLVCLNCGKKFKQANFASHMVNCNFFLSIFFHPRMNTLKIITHIGSTPVEFSMPGPYLTQFGEVKSRNNSGKATLNQERYKELNRMWLNQSLYSFVTRNIFGTREADFNGNNTNFDFQDALEEDFNDFDGDGTLYDIDPFVF